MGKQTDRRRAEINLGPGEQPPRDRVKSTWVGHAINLGRSEFNLGRVGSTWVGLERVEKAWEINPGWGKESEMQLVEGRGAVLTEGGNPVAVRQRAVEAFEEQQHLETRLAAVTALAERLEATAIEAATGELRRLRAILDRRVEALKEGEALAERLHQATAHCARLKESLRYQRW